MPPTSVPASEPIPPITTASKAKISCIGRSKRKRLAHGEKYARQPSGSNRDPLLQ